MSESKVGSLRPGPVVKQASTGFASIFGNSEVQRCCSCNGALDEDAGDDFDRSKCAYCIERDRKAALKSADQQHQEGSGATNGTYPAASDRSALVSEVPTSDIPDGHILIGMEGDKNAVTLDLRQLSAGRCLVQGFSGAGKSTTLRRIIEQAYTFTTMVILDIEGELSNVVEHIGAVSVKAAEVSADGLTKLALKSREHRIPFYLDLTDLDPDTRIAKACAFLSGLLSSPKIHWKNTVMVVIDEAHLIAPQVAATARDAEMRKLGVATLADFCSRGRKRGICPVVGTQRLAKLAPSVRSELQNVLIGNNVLNADILTAGEILGFSRDRAALLRDLEPGQFVAFGPAISRTPRFIKICSTITEHAGATPELRPSAGLAPSDARKLLEVDEALNDSAVLEKASAGAATAQVGRGALDTFLLEPAAGLAVRVVEALIPIMPNATTVSGLGRRLNAETPEINEAVEILIRVGAIEVMPRGEERLARVSKRLRLRATPVQVVELV